MEERQLSIIVLYADFAGSAETVGSMSPKEIRRLYSIPLDEMTHVVEDFGGTVLKYAEKCVVGFFVLPGAGWTELIDRVLLCIEMMQKVMDHSIAPTLRLKGLPMMGCRIGIDCGTVQILGIRVKSIYTDVDVFGDVVDLSRRICDEAESGEILIGKNLWQLLYASHKMRCEKRKDLLRNGDTYELHSLNY
jgi:adenylate cyclase